MGAGSNRGQVIVESIVFLTFIFSLLFLINRHIEYFHKHIKSNYPQTHFSSEQSYDKKKISSFNSKKNN